MGIVLSELSQTDKDKYLTVSLYIWNLHKRKPSPQITENRLVIVKAGGGEWGKMGERGWKLQSSSYETNKSGKCNV